MPCDAVRALNFAAADGELNAPELVAIEAHLQRCTPCRILAASDAAFLRMIRVAVSLESAPPSLHARIAALFRPRTSARASA